MSVNQQQTGEWAPDWAPEAEPEYKVLSSGNILFSLTINYQNRSLSRQIKKL